jgi:hypothetical protein
MPEATRLHKIESSKCFVKHAVHLAVKREEWMNVAIPVSADLATFGPGVRSVIARVLLRDAVGFRRGQHPAEAP